MIVARIDKTKNGQETAVLEVDGKVIVKVYASPNERKIRIVLPELRNYRQTLICPDKKLLEFDRDA